MGRRSRSKLGREKGREGKGRTRAKEDMGVPLIMVAELTLESLHKKHSEEAPVPRDPEGSMLGSKWISMQLDYDGRKIRVTVPAIILAKASRDFQLGYIYSSLVRKVKPRIKECPDCGKLHDPLYGVVGGTLYKVDAA